jgi:uncharacterized protein (DUF2126 family)
MDYGFGAADARRFAETLARALGVSEAYLVPAFEDTLYYLWKDGGQPVNVDLLGADLKNPDERRRLVQLLAGDLGQPAGYALPLRWNDSQKCWQSSCWTFRRGHLFLTPGDSPLGCACRSMPCLGRRGSGTSNPNATCSNRARPWVITTAR